MAKAVSAQATNKRSAKKAAATKTQAEKRTGVNPRKQAAAKPLSAPVKRVATPAEPLTHRLDALLHTIRCIAQHEDQLCGLLHDARKTGRVSSALRRELQALLTELPAEEYTHDLHAVLAITAVA